MEIINLISIIGTIILFFILLLFIIIFIRRNRRNNRRITPEMYQRLAQLIRARNIERVCENYKIKKREIEMIKMKDSIVIVNPNEDIVLGV